MPIDTSLIGTAVGPNVEEVDARWAMAYAAGLGDMQDCYMDTRREEESLRIRCFRFASSGR